MVDFMPVFKAVNILTLLLPDQDGETNTVRKLDCIPPDFIDLPWIHRRTDKKYSGHLEDQDTVILMIEIADQHEVYEITCKKDHELESDMSAVSFSSANS